MVLGARAGDWVLGIIASGLNGIQGAGLPESLIAKEADSRPEGAIALLQHEFGLARIGWAVTLTAAACNPVRLPKLLAGAA